MAYDFPDKYHISPKENVESAIGIINELGWHLDGEQSPEGRWVVFSGGEERHATFLSNQRSEAEAFI